MLLNLVLNGNRIKHLYDSLEIFRWHLNFDITVEFHNDNLLIYKDGGIHSGIYRVIITNDKFSQFQCEIPNRRMVISYKSLISILSGAAGCTKFDELIIRMTDTDVIKFIRKNKVSTFQDEIKIQKFDDKILVVPNINFDGYVDVYGFFKIIKHLPKSGYIKIDVAPNNVYITTKDKNGSVASHILTTYSQPGIDVSNKTYNDYFAINDKTFISNFRDAPYSFEKIETSIFFAQNKEIGIMYNVGDTCDVKYLQYPVTLADNQKFENAYMLDLNGTQDTANAPTLPSDNKLDDTDINQVWI